MIELRALARNIFLNCQGRANVTLRVLKNGKGRKKGGWNDVI